MCLSRYRGKGTPHFLSHRRWQKNGQWPFGFCLLLVSMALGDSQPAPSLPTPWEICQRVGTLSQYTPYSYYLTSGNQPQFLPHHLPPCHRDETSIHFSVLWDALCRHVPTLKFYTSEPQVITVFEDRSLQRWLCLNEPTRMRSDQLTAVHTGKARTGAYIKEVM